MESLVVKEKLLEDIAKVLPSVEDIIGDPKCSGFNDGVKAAMSVVKAEEPVQAVDAVPVEELNMLRDALYYNDQITMAGLANLNALIAKHDGKEHKNQ